MSKFIDKLNRVSQVMSQPIGFRMTQPVSPKPKMLLVASLPQINVGSVVDYMAGADAGLLHISKLGSPAKILPQLSQAVPNIPWGGWLGDSSQQGIKQMAKAGCDFMVFPAANTPLAIPRSEEAGKILEVESSLSEGLLRAINKLPVDAVLITCKQKESDFLTWYQLMLFQRFADLLTKPLLVSIPLSITASELQALWEAGVDGVIVEIGARGELKELRRKIDKLAFPSPHKREKVEPLLPRISQEPSIVTTEEEEEE